MAESVEELEGDSGLELTCKVRIVFTSRSVRTTEVFAQSGDSVIVGKTTTSRKVGGESDSPSPA